jgi:short subunit fatty acids transporter
MKRFRRFVLVLVLIGGCAGAAALAQQPPPSEFVPVGPGDLQQEQIPAARLVFAAYAFVWAVFIVYLVALWRRMTRVEADLKAVSEKLGRAGG